MTSRKNLPPRLGRALAIPDPASFSEVSSALAEFNESIADWEPIDKQGCWLTPNVVNAAELEGQILPTLTELHWIVTSLKDNRVLIEPRHTQYVVSNPPGPVFHVTAREARASILTTGLELGVGGNTRMQRKYPPRIFCAFNLLAAFEFAEFQCRPNLPAVTKSGEMVRLDRKKSHDVDIWRVRLPADARLRCDVLFQGKAGWIEEQVPPENLSRVMFWRWTYDLWCFARKRGFA